MMGEDARKNCSSHILRSKSWINDRGGSLWPFECGYSHYRICSAGACAHHQIDLNHNLTIEIKCFFKHRDRTTQKAIEFEKERKTIKKFPLTAQRQWLLPSRSRKNSCYQTDGGFLVVRITKIIRTLYADRSVDHIYRV